MKVRKSPLLWFDFGILTIAISSVSQAVPAIEFNRDIRPLLADACFRCHGFDKQAREADLRLDTPEGAFAGLSGVATIVPGKPDDISRVRHDQVPRSFSLEVMRISMGRWSH